MKKATLWLHVGAGKTGTASLQRTMFASVPALAEAGLAYPGDRFNHLDVVRGLIAGDPGPLRALLGETTLPETLLSTEAAIRLDDERTMRLRAEAEARFERIRLVLYVREPVSWAISQGNQGIKLGRKTYSEVFVKPGVFPARQAIEKWWAAFGVDALTVAKYDRRTLAAGDIVDDFLERIGKPGLATRLTRQRANEALSMEAALTISHHVETCRAEGKRPRGGKLRAMRDIPGERITFPASFAERVRERAARDLAFLKDNFGIVFDEA